MSARCLKGKLFGWFIGGGGLFKDNEWLASLHGTNILRVNAVCLQLWESYLKKLSPIHVQWNSVHFSIGETVNDNIARLDTEQ